MGVCVKHHSYIPRVMDGESPATKRAPQAKAHATNCLHDLPPRDSPRLPMTETTKSNDFLRCLAIENSRHSKSVVAEHGNERHARTEPNEGHEQ